MQLRITLRVKFENSFKLAQAFRQMESERIFKYHEWSRSPITRAFILITHLLYD